VNLLDRRDFRQLKPQFASAGSALPRLQVHTAHDINPM
jgi:hypothetical protein